MKTNQDLKLAHLPHCDWRSFMTYTGPDGTAPSPQEVEALDHYFQHFVPPGVCIKCGHQQGAASIIDVVRGESRFVWGIKNGEGQCSTGGCGWPARAIHRDVGPIKCLEMILQYHPDIVTWDV